MPSSARTVSLRWIGGGEGPLTHARPDDFGQQGPDLLAVSGVPFAVLGRETPQFWVEGGQASPVGHVQHYRLDNVDELLSRIGTGVRGRFHPPGELGRAEFEDGDECALLAVVVVVQRGHGLADASGDVAHCGAVKSMFVEGIQGGREQRGSSPLPAVSPVRAALNF